MTTDVDSPTGNRDADSPNNPPEMRRSTGPAADGPASAPAGSPGSVSTAARVPATPAARAPGSVSETARAPRSVLKAAGSAGGGSEVVADPSAGTQEVRPIGWEVAAAEGETFFRFPAADDPDPGWPRLLGMSLYAAILGLAGVLVGVRGLTAAIGSSAPGWYVPLLAGAGLLSVGLTVAAFLSIHRRLLPWMLLLAAAVPLGTAVILAVAY